jgi:hypothetical protein
VTLTGVPAVAVEGAVTDKCVADDAPTEKAPFDMITGIVPSFKAALTNVSAVELPAAPLTLKFRTANVPGPPTALAPATATIILPDVLALYTTDHPVVSVPAVAEVAVSTAGSKVTVKEAPRRPFTCPSVTGI